MHDYQIYPTDSLLVLINCDAAINIAGRLTGKEYIFLLRRSDHKSANMHQPRWQRNLCFNISAYCIFTKCIFTNIYAPKRKHMFLKIRLRRQRHNAHLVNNERSPVRHCMIDKLTFFVNVMSIMSNFSITLFTLYFF